MWHKPCRTFHPWCPCIKTRCLLCTLVASLMSLMASLVTTSRMQRCFNVPIDSYHEFLLLFYCCVLLEINLLLLLLLLLLSSPIPTEQIHLAHALMHTLNTLRPRQNGRHFADDIFNGIFLNENVWIPIKFSLKFVPKGQINNIPALV